MPTICQPGARHNAARKGALAMALTAFAATAIFATAAFAAHPVKGKTYAGSLLPAIKNVSVSFKVSASGKRVTALVMSNLPLYCQGGGGILPVKFRGAKVSKSGTFKSSATQVILAGPFKGQIGAKIAITGKFTKGGEHGTVKTTYLKAPSCSGQSNYTTTVSG